MARYIGEWRAMAFKGGWRAVACAAGLVGCGVVGDAAWRSSMWASVAGAILVATWLGLFTWWLVVQKGPALSRANEAPRDLTTDRLVLDVAPTPMVMIDGPNVRALNRAARRLFGADDRIVPAPVSLLQYENHYLRHEGRQYRIDRVMLATDQGRRSVAALIDVEQEERLAEARATAEMIHVLGHELLNGLAPIVSLAESAEAALNQSVLDHSLLHEILGTLARRAEGLQRFTQGYRELARLPLPRRTSVPLSSLTDDLVRMFKGRWPEVALIVRIDDGPDWSLDRDQIHQALWAILQNAAQAATASRDQDPRVVLTFRFEIKTMVVEVQDSGPGVQPEHMTRIFRPFHTTKPNGTGIGLSLARQVALAHGGSLTFLPMKPTTFRLAVPHLDVETA